MGDTVVNLTIYQNKHFAYVRSTCIGDGTGEGTAVKKVDVSALSPACHRLIIRQIWWSVGCCRLQILEDATTDVVLFTFGAYSGDTFIGVDSGHWDFRKWPKSGIQNTEATGATGDLMIITDGVHADTDSHYTILMELEKVNPE